MGPGLQTISFLRSSPGRAKERRRTLCLHRSFQRSWEKEKRPRVGQTIQLGPPGLSHQPAQPRAAGEAEVGQRQEGLGVWARCPWWQGAQHPQRCRERRGKPRSGHGGGQAACSLLEGSLCSLLPARTPHRRWLRGARRVPGGHSGRKRGNWFSLETFPPKLN